MQQWEYRFVSVEFNNGQYMDVPASPGLFYQNAESRWNRLGEQGWDVIGQSIQYTAGNLRAIFKRPLIEPSHSKEARKQSEDRILGGL